MLEPVRDRAPCVFDRSDDGSDDDECILCMDALRTMVLVPCGHLQLCAECAALCTVPGGGSGCCLTCREPIEEVVEAEL